MKRDDHPVPAGISSGVLMWVVLLLLVAVGLLILVWSGDSHREPDWIYERN